jgi:hypothetical protein
MRGPSIFCKLQKATSSMAATRAAVVPTFWATTFCQGHLVTNPTFPLFFSNPAPTTYTEERERHVDGGATSKLKRLYPSIED